MPRYRRFQAWILNDGIVLREYATMKNGNIISCYIEGNPGETFSVHWKNWGVQAFSAGYIVVDGIIAPGRFLNGGGETFRSGMRSGPDSEILFTFADVPVEGPGPSFMIPANAVGTVELKIVLTERGEPKPNNDPKVLTSYRNQMLARKGPEHQVVAQAKENPYLPQYPLTWSGTQPGGGPPRSYVKFVFYYRQRPWLQKHGLLDLRPNRPPSMDISRIKKVRDPLSYVAKLIHIGTVYESDSEDACEDEDDDVMNRRFIRLGKQPKASSSNSSDTTEKYYPSGTSMASSTTEQLAAMKTMVLDDTPGPGLQVTSRSYSNLNAPVYAKYVTSTIPGFQQAEDAQRDMSMEGIPSSSKSKGKAPARSRTSRKPKPNRQNFEELMARIDPEGEHKRQIKYVCAKYGRPRVEAAQPEASQSKGKAPAGSQRKARPPPPAAIEQHPQASNTYILPAGSTPAPSQTMARSNCAPPYAPFPIPGRTPSGRPSAIIDTRIFGPGYAASVASGSNSGIPGSSSSVYPQYSQYPAHGYSGGN